MSLPIKFTDEAEDTYTSLISQLLFRWGNEFVIKFESKVDKTLKIISETPFLYPVSNGNVNTRKCVLHKNCSMYYIIKDGYIEVLYFWDNRQDPVFLL